MQTVYSNSDVVLKFVNLPAGDYTGNGVVDAADYTGCVTRLANRDHCCVPTATATTTSMPTTTPFGKRTSVSQPAAVRYRTQPCPYPRP